MTEERKKSSLPELPFEPPDPLEALEKFDSVINELDSTVKGIDGRIGEMDRKVTEIDKRFTIPTLPKPKPTPKPERSHSHEPYTGSLDYCVECAVKHSQTAKVLMREALQRASAGSPADEGVQEKVRGAVEELSGLEDDTDTIGRDPDAERVRNLNTAARTLRKYVYATRAEIGEASFDTLKEIKGMVDQLVDACYSVRKSCVACTVEELCGGNLECVEFLEKAYKKAKSPEEFKEFISEARKKYRRG